MPWSSLSTRLNLPLVMCGPILRRVERTSVTVWVVLTRPCQITLRVFTAPAASGRTELKLIGSRYTLQLGDRVHIAAITASAVASDQHLDWGEIYTYNLYFRQLEAGHSLPGPTPPTELPDTADNLNSAGIVNMAIGTPNPISLAYAPYTLPSFALSPNDINHVRILHGSCRKSHGPSLDALEALDYMIGEAPTNPLRRPHALFLTGDQIYADDVPDALLYMFQDAEAPLFGWSEVLPLPSGTDPNTLRPGQRATLVGQQGAGFTTGAGKSHLLKLAEFCAMYLFVWSDVLWGATDLPRVSDVRPGATRWETGNFDVEIGRLNSLRRSLRSVRKGLANVPVYMIFDDHEISDDWYMNLEWCMRVLGTNLGRRVVQNGLLAYALFQGWGNDPAQYATAGSPGARLLQLAEEWSVSRGVNSAVESQIAQRLSIPPDGAATHRNRSLPHSLDSVRWHYRVNGPRYEALVLDTRTWRFYPMPSTIEYPILVSDSGLDAQFSSFNPPERNIEITFVIIPAPLLNVPVVEVGQRIITNPYLGNTYQNVFDHDAEGYSLSAKGFESLLSRLALRIPSQSPDSPPVRPPHRYVVLSGDVHYGFTARMQYWAEQPFGASRYEPCEYVLAMLTSSALKNECYGTRSSTTLHHDGYSVFNALYRAARSQVSSVRWRGIPIPLPENPPLPNVLPDPVNIVAWANSGRQRFAVTHNVTLSESPALHWWNNTDPLNSGLTPEWSYRIDFIRADNEYDLGGPLARLFPPPTPAPIGPPTRFRRLEGYVTSARNARDYAQAWGIGKEIVGVNNMGDISFQGTATDRQLIHDLWWRLESRDRVGELLPPHPLSRFIVSLAHNDTRYPRPAR